MIFEWTPQAKKDYKSRQKNISKKADKAFKLFEKDAYHPSLHVEKIDLNREIWSARIDLNYRFTFQWIQGGILVRAMGSHQIIYRRRNAK